MFDRQILRRAVGDSFVKLDPRHMVRNPVTLSDQSSTFASTMGSPAGMVAAVAGASHEAGTSAANARACWWCGEPHGDLEREETREHRLTRTEIGQDVKG